MDLSERAAGAATLDRDGLLALVADQRAALASARDELSWVSAGSDRYESLVELCDSAAYDHFKALGRTWRRGELTFGECAEMLPLELERLRFLLSPYHGESGDVTEPWIQTWSGGTLYPLQPDPYEIEVADIAAALAKVCRFNGHVVRFYSVGDHSVRVAELCEEPLRFRALLHDAGEYAWGDPASPIKHAPEMWALRRAHQWIQRVVYQRFGIEGPDPPELKRVDRVLVATEARDLLKPHRRRPGWWRQYGEPLPGRIEPRSPEEAEAKFLEMFETYKPK